MAPKTILLVEDEPLLIKFVSSVLLRAGFAVLSAESADEALRLEADFTPPIDLLLTGVSLPRVSGAELAQRLEWRRPGIPVVLMSGDPTVQPLATSYGWHFIQKPFLAAALVRLIGDALGLEPVVASAARA